MAFADHLDIATFTTLASMSQGLERDRLQRDEIDPAVLGHLGDVRDAGSMAVVENVENRDVRLVDAWNAFVNGTTVFWQRTLADGLSDMVLVYAIKGQIDGEKDDVDADAAMAAAYQALCLNMDEGRMVGTTFHPAVPPRPQFDDLQCGRTGDRCRLVVENWIPRLERFDRTAQASGYWLPVEPVAAPVVETVEIDLPTGVLLMSDYLRAPGIHEAIEERIEDAIGDRRYEGTHSVNSERGRVTMTRIMVEVAGVLQVCTTNTTVAIHQSEDRLVVTENHADNGSRPTVAGMTQTGEVCCDRWTVLLADRQDVLALMDDDGTLLDAYLASDDGRDTTVVNVTPGRWRVSFGEALSDRGTAASIGVVSAALTWFSMERID